jgi:cyanuric acid amidohydrolase
VIVKGPTLSREMIDDARSRGKDVVTTDLGAGEHGAFCYANDAAALGVALALGEVPEGSLSDDVVRQNWDLYSEVASTSAAPDKVRAEILVLGNSTAGLGDLRIGHGVTKDLIDTTGVKDALRSAGMRFDCCPSDADLERVVQVFAKLIIPQDGRARGHRNTLLDDIEAAKTTKSMGGALIGSVIGRTAFYMSGGERNSHQGPPGGSPVAAVIRA